MASKERATGIDVSHYKKRIDWKKVKDSGVQFAIIKATEAENFVDPRFDYNWTRTRRQGIIRGAYHFFRPLADPVRQANNFIKIAGRTLHKTDLPPVVDIESYPDFIGQEWKQISLNERLRRIQIWLQTVEAATGRVPIIYTEYYSWRDFIGNTEKFSRHPLWIANYRVEQPKIPANNWGGNGWTLWQTTEKGVVPGIRDEAPCVDLDVYRSTFDDLNAWLKIAQPRALPPDVTNGDMMAALVDTADLLGISSDDFVNRASLRYLVDPIGNSLRPYDGPAVNDLTITNEEKQTLAKVLENVIGTNSASWSISHQDLINAFYAAPSLDGTRGWRLVEQAGLDYIGEDRAALYHGPVIEQLPGLNQQQRAAISNFLGLESAIVGISQDDDPDQIDEPDLTVVDEPLPVEPEHEELITEDQFDNSESFQDILDEVPEDELSTADVTQPEPTYGNHVDNQAMINAFYLAAIKLDQNGREIITAAGLAHLLEARMEVYSGPRLEVLPGLTPVQRETIAELLGIQLNDSLVISETDLMVEVEEQIGEEMPITVEVEPASDSPVEEATIIVGDTGGNDEPVVVGIEEPEQVVNPVLRPTYPGLVNQDLINLFYKVAAFFGENGWQWLVNCGLAAIGETRQMRFEDYKGPQIKSIPGLTEDQRSHLEREINQLKYV